MIYRAPLFVLGIAGCGRKALIEKLSENGKTIECSIPNAATKVILEPVYKDSVDELPQCAFAIAFVYDITSVQSFDFVTAQIKSLNARLQAQPDFAPARIMVGTHRDLDTRRSVTYDQTTFIKNSIKALWLETGFPAMNYEVLQRHMSIRMVYSVKDQKQLPIIPQSALSPKTEDISELKTLNLPLNYREQLVQVIADDTFEQYAQESAKKTIVGQQIEDQANDHIMESHFFRETFQYGPRTNFFDNPYVRNERSDSTPQTQQPKELKPTESQPDLALSFKSFLANHGTQPKNMGEGSNSVLSSFKQFTKPDTEDDVEKISLAPTFKPSGPRRFDANRLLAQCTQQPPPFKVTAIRTPGIEKPLRTGSMLEDDSNPREATEHDTEPRELVRDPPRRGKAPDLALSTVAITEPRRPEKLKVKLSELVTKTAQPACVYVTVQGKTIPVNVLETDNAFVVAEQIARQHGLNQSQIIALTKQLQPQILALSQPVQRARSPVGKKEKPAKPGKSFFISVNNKRGKVSIRDGQSVTDVARQFCELMQLDQEKWVRAAIAAIQAELTKLRIEPCTIINPAKCAQ